MAQIITHPGSSHKDDFLATCVLLAVLNSPKVFRREPTRADLDNPDTYVVDVGFEYNPERHNFDHHHDPLLPCAFHLVMQYLGYHDAAMALFGWYAHMSMMDVSGPYQTAEHLGVDSNLFYATSSPIDGYIISMFANVESLSSQDSLYSLMKALGEDMIAMIDRKMKRLELLKVEAKVVPVNQFKAVVSEIENTPKLAMELYLRFLNDDRIIISITPSNRGVGWELVRIGHNTFVDFRAIERHPKIRFVHSTGFLAKTNLRFPIPEVLQLACMAIKAP
jgi:hypothetical protein